MWGVRGDARVGRRDPEWLEVTGRLGVMWGHMRGTSISGVPESSEK